jgi:predicted RNA-binding protein with PUA domain
VSGLQVDVDNDKINDLLVLSGSVLTALSGQNGTTIWIVDISGKDADIRDVIVATEELKAYGIGFMGDSGFTMIEIDLQTGTITDRRWL